MCMLTVALEATFDGKYVKKKNTENQISTKGKNIFKYFFA